MRPTQSLFYTSTPYLSTSEQLLQQQYHNHVHLPRAWHLPATMRNKTSRASCALQYFVPLSSIPLSAAEQHTSLYIWATYLSLHLSNIPLSLHLSSIPLSTSEQHTPLSTFEQHTSLYIWATYLSLYIWAAYLSLHLSNIPLSLHLSSIPLSLHLSSIPLSTSEQHTSTSQQHTSLHLSSIPLHLSSIPLHLSSIPLSISAAYLYISAAYLYISAAYLSLHLSSMPSPVPCSAEQRPPIPPGHCQPQQSSFRCEQLEAWDGPSRAGIRSRWWSSRCSWWSLPDCWCPAHRLPKTWCAQ